MIFNNTVRIIPIKFVFILTIICLVLFPAILYLLLLSAFYLFTLGNSIVPFEVTLILLIAGVFIEIVFLFAPEYCKVIISNGAISNFIFDGTHNSGWRENISEIKTVSFVSRKEVQKHYEQFKKSKAILIDFGNHKIRYIYAGWFSKKQVKKIIDILSK